MIASNSGGNTESVEHGKTGLLFKPCDINSLDEALKRLINDKGLRQSMGMAGRNKVKQFFTLDKMIKKTENFFQCILNKRMDHKGIMAA